MDTSGYVKTNAYKATVVSSYPTGEVERHTTYVTARTPEEARRVLCHEGYEVKALWVIEVPA